MTEVKMPGRHSFMDIMFRA